MAASFVNMSLISTAVTVLWCHLIWTILDIIYRCGIAFRESWSSNHRATTKKSKRSSRCHAPIFSASIAAGILFASIRIGFLLLPLLLPMRCSAVFLNSVILHFEMSPSCWKTVVHSDGFVPPFHFAWASAVEKRARRSRIPFPYVFCSVPCCILHKIKELL